MTEAIITVLVLAIAGGIVAIYLLKLKPMQKSKVKDLYAEGLDLMIAGRRKAAFKSHAQIPPQNPTGGSKKAPDCALASI